MTLFLWHMPDDATEGVAEHKSRLQSQSICMPLLQLLCSAALVPNVLPRRDESSGKPCAVIKALYYFSPTQDSNPGGRIQYHKR